MTITKDKNLVAAALRKAGLKPEEKLAPGTRVGYLTSETVVRHAGTSQSYRENLTVPARVVRNTPKRVTILVDGADRPISVHRDFLTIDLAAELDWIQAYLKTQPLPPRKTSIEDAIAGN
jgi:hypothetical protein